MGLSEALAGLFTGAGKGLEDLINARVQNDQIKYKRSRDAVADQQWQQSFDLQQRREQEEEAARRLQDQRLREDRFLREMGDLGVGNALAAAKGLAGQGAIGMDEAERRIGSYAFNAMQDAARQGLPLQPQELRDETGKPTGAFFIPKGFGAGTDTSGIHYFTGDDSHPIQWNPKSGQAVKLPFKVRDTNANGLTVLQGPSGEISVVDKRSRTATPVTTQGGGQALGQGARPGEAELNSAALFSSIKPSFDRMNDLLKKRNFQPYDYGTEVAVNALREQGTGVMSTTKRVAANNYLKSQSPDAQALAQAVNAFVTQVTYLMSGKQINEAEGQRLLNMFSNMSGDSPDLVQQKLSTAEEVLNSQVIKANRARGLIGQGNSETTTPQSSGNKPSLDEIFGH